MTDKELLQAISGMIDSKLEPVIENMATKADLENMATKSDIENMATKNDVNVVFNELMNIEKWLSNLDDKQKILTDKVDTLLLKSDNTTLLLQLINRQGMELETVKERMDKLEKRIS